jgi:hypothetical protein
MATEVKKKDHKEAKPLEKMTVKELKAIAMEIPRTTSVHDMKKEELIVFIKQTRGTKGEEPAKKVKDSEKLKTKQDMKAKIKLFKEERITAQEKKDRKKVKFLRRRISRLKKQTRREVRVGV